MPFNFRWNKFNKDGGKHNLRRYYLIAGSCLLVVITVFSLLVYRWGTVPSPVLPGFEEAEKGETQLPVVDALELEMETETGFANSEQKGEPNDLLPGVKGELPAGETDETIAETPGIIIDGDTNRNEAGSGTSGELVPVFPGETDEENDDKQHGLSELPAAAQPLPVWGLDVPFGNYHASSLPSGATAHYLSSGVLLRTMPAAPVSALWDGVVSQIKVMDGLYRCSVLIEHTDYAGEHSTFYGNMREVWVKKGATVSRGENIGLMAYAGRDGGTPAPDSNGETQQEYETSLPVSGYPPAAGKSLDMHTVWSGFLDDNNDLSWEERERRASSPEATVPAFLPEEESQGLPREAPLLYLEVRRGNHYLDPLDFIKARH